MIPLNDEMREWMAAVYKCTMRELGVYVFPEELTINEDCSCTVSNTFVDDDLRTVMDEHADVTIVRYEPGTVTFIDQVMQQYHDAVGPHLRRKAGLS